MHGYWSVHAPCCVYILSVYILSVYILSVYILSVYILSVYILSVYILSVYILSVYIVSISTEKFVSIHSPPQSLQSWQLWVTPLR